MNCMQLIENASSEKLRGGYYTPREIADFILRWGLRDSLYTDILEPSCGDGAFLKALKTMGCRFHSLTAVEYNQIEAEKAMQVGIGDVVNADFHAFCRDTDKKFNLIVGNPPFIRYQYYNEKQQQIAEELFKRAGMKFSKLTNAWVTFIIGCSLLLQKRGRIGFVVPAELLQVGYALKLREFLSKFYNTINIISFKNWYSRAFSKKSYCYCVRRTAPQIILSTILNSKMPMSWKHWMSTSWDVILRILISDRTSGHFIFVSKGNRLVGACQTK